jgi:hypothetical protein
MSIRRQDEVPVGWNKQIPVLDYQCEAIRRFEKRKDCRRKCGEIRNYLCR